MKISLISIFLVFLGLTNHAQTAVEHFRKGNQYYQSKEFSKAEIEYRKGLETPSPYAAVAQYNLANALMQQGNTEGARALYQTILQENEDLNPAIAGKIHYNIGNSYLNEKKYQESISPYIEALKRNPFDKQASYNLSYALKMLKQQQQKDKNKDQNKDKKDQNNNKNKDQKKPEESKDQQEKKNQQQQQQISKSQAEKLMKAMQNKEKETQKALHQKDSGKKVNSIGNKDW